MIGDPIRFGVQAGPDSGSTAWLDLAAKAEDLGFDALYVADHIGVAVSPFVALAAAAAVTSTLRLGTYVVNCGVRDPLSIASDAATLDQLSDGRVVLGLGAGHTPAEWTMSGRAYPSAAQRVGRLAETVEAVEALLRGATVTSHGGYFELDEAVLAQPRPVQERIPILVGGNGPALLQFAGRTADVVGLTGLGRTLPDGHRHEVDWRRDAIDERVALVRTGRGGTRHAPGARPRSCSTSRSPSTTTATTRPTRCAQMAPGMTAADVVTAPYTLVGSVEQILEELVGHRERWGITSYVVRTPAIDLVAPIIEQLRTL